MHIIVWTRPCVNLTTCESLNDTIDLVESLFLHKRHCLIVSFFLVDYLFAIYIKYFFSPQHNFWFVLLLETPRSRRWLRYRRCFLFFLFLSSCFIIGADVHANTIVYWSHGDIHICDVEKRAFFRTNSEMISYKRTFDFLNMTKSQN